MSDPTNDPIFTNSSVYHAIAVQAMAASESAFRENSRPKADGSPGYVMTLDPERRSFKQSMIAIVFSGMYIEAQLWLHGCRLLGVDKYGKIDKQPLEMRLQPLGISDQKLQDDLKAFRESRKALVHEKPVPFSTDTSPIRTAQTEAAKAVALMELVDNALASSNTSSQILSHDTPADASADHPDLLR